MISTMSIAVCIPSCGKHLHYLRRCLDSIEAQTVKPTKVIVSCSSTVLTSLQYDGYSFPVTLLLTRDPKNAAENRNRTIEYADTDIVTFIDVDDTMHRERIEFILQAFSNPCDIVLHAFSFSSIPDTSMNPFIFYDALIKAPTGCAMIKGSRPHLATISIAHAHVSVRRNILDLVKFPEETEYTLKTDSIFCGRVLSLPDIRSAYILNPLTHYMPSNSAYETTSRPLIFCFWTGDTPMSETRTKSIEQMKEVTECEVVLVTKDTLDKYILPQHPLHEAYHYLSETQKSDYLRTYFMHFYGHGYSDIKRQSGSWLPAFKAFYESDAYVSGYPESCEDDIGYRPVREHWRELVGCGAYICRPQTPYTTKWYGEMMDLMDRKVDELRQNPARFPQDCKEAGTGYPLEWSEPHGRIFHKVCYEFRNRVQQNVPKIICTDYR